ncbi:unnamed protein product [Caretta caretta]
MKKCLLLSHIPSLVTRFQRPCLIISMSGDLTQVSKVALRETFRCSKGTQETPKMSTSLRGPEEDNIRGQILDFSREDNLRGQILEFLTLKLSNDNTLSLN